MSQVQDLFNPEDEQDLPTQIFGSVWRDEDIVYTQVGNTTLSYPIDDFLVFGRLYGVIAKKLTQDIPDDKIEIQIKAEFLKQLRDDKIAIIDIDRD